MSLNLILTGGLLDADPQRVQLVVNLQGLGVRILILGSSLDLTQTGAQSAPWPQTARELAAWLDQQGWSPDETVFFVSSVAEAELAQALRLKVAASPLLPVAADERWPDLGAATQYFERQAQLSKRAWPIATVGGLVFAPDRSALFVRTAKWGGTWGVPGGKIDYGETHLAAFLREIREETGLVATQPELVLVQDAIEEPEFFRPRHFLLLNYVAQCSDKQFCLNHESLEAGWFALSEATKLPLNRPTRQLVEHLLKA